MRVFRSLLVVAAMLSACGKTSSNSTGIACGGVASVSIYVGVQDARTGVPAARGASLQGIHHFGTQTDTVAGGALSDSLMVIAGVPGTYALSVKKSGYMDWTATLVLPDDIQCNPHAYSLSASLQPAA